MKLFAISDLHLDYEHNRNALCQMRSYPDDWLIVAGDVGHSTKHFHFAFEQLGKRFAQLIWVPGNHDLWTTPNTPGDIRGEQRYQQLVTLCREYGVLCPEDDYTTWPGSSADDEARQLVIAPLFLLYDYSFRPEQVSFDQALEWAKETGVVCADEYYLHPDPHPTREAWCKLRCEQTVARIEARLAQSPDASLILINHWPLVQRLAVLPRVPRFTLWCGTTRSNDWHTRFSVEAVVYGHLHIRRSSVIDGVRFEEVSLGYPRHWDAGRGVDGYLRQIIG